MKFKVAIIGLGNIGFNYDADFSYKSHTLTHFRAFEKHPNFEIVAAVDPHNSSERLSTHKFNFPIFDDIEKLFNNFIIDVFVIANPTDLHCKTGFSILNASRPLAILCEKPISYEYKEAQRFNDQCNRAKVNLFVNYFRRADPAILKIKTLLKSGKIEGPFVAEATYTKGIVHNGTHFLDLFYFLFGNILHSKTLKKEKVIGFYNDMKADVVYYFKEGQLSLISIDEYEPNVPVFSCKFSKYEIEYFNNGQLILTNTDSITNRKETLESRLIFSGNKNHYQYDIACQLFNALENKEHNLCNGKQALDTLYWATKLLEENEIVKN